MKTIISVLIATGLAVLMAGSSLAADWRLEAYADSTLAGQSGYLALSTEADGPTETLFLVEEAGHVRIFATRDGGSQVWEFLAAGGYIAPAVGQGLGTSWSTLFDDLDRASTSTLEAFESIIVPAGTLMGARCVVHPNVAPGLTTEIRHFVQGVGLVSDFFPGDGADVLNSFSVVGGSGYMPLAVGNWWEFDWADNATPAGDQPLALNLLYPSVPNPFNPSTLISFEMAGAGHASLKVYDVAGNLVRTLVDDERGAGRHSVTWDGRNESGWVAATGVYLYRFETGTSVQTRRMTLVK